MTIDVFDTEWGKALKLEQKVAHICAEQERYGWTFDDERALEVRYALSAEKEAIDSILRPSLPPRRVKMDKVEVLAPFTSSGKLAVRASNWFKDAAESVKGPYSKVDWEPFNLASVAQVKEFLLALGWEPDTWNYNDEGEITSPKLIESSLVRLEHPLGKHIARREVIEHRISLVDGLLSNVRDDGRIPSAVNPIGAATHRATHRIVANIPKALPEVYYGEAIRELFTVPQGAFLLGFDAKGLQLRCLAHYINDPVFTESILHGDVHHDNWQAIGTELCSTRARAKNILYALLFGAGDKKLATTAGHSGSDAQLSAIGYEIRERLVSRCGGFAELTEGVKRAAARGYLYSIDGRKLWLRGTHQALNTLLQNMEAVVMKVAMCIMEDWKQEHRLFQSHQVGWFHDEFQWEVHSDELEKVREGAQMCITQAGEWLGSNCLLESDVKIGKNWHDTH